MTKDLKDAIKQEITNDPDKKGYAGKTPKQIADLMNQPTTVKTDIIKQAEPVIEVPVEVDVKVGDKIGEKVDVKDAPVLRVVLGIPGAPNALSIKDIQDALA